MPYPQYPRSGIPAALRILPQTATLPAGGRLQLLASLNDANGDVVSPSQPFTYRSGNPKLLTLDASGLCTAASTNYGGQVEVAVTYPWADSNIATLSASAFITVILHEGNHARPD